MRKHSPWLWLALLVASLALVAAGCGGDDEEAGDTGATTAAGGAEAAEQVITVNWGTEPPSLDPGLASDVTSANILLNIMDPLVKLGDDLEPVPSLAESWQESDGGKTVTFTFDLANGSFTTTAATVTATAGPVKVSAAGGRLAVGAGATGPIFTATRNRPRLISRN